MNLPISKYQKLIIISNRLSWYYYSNVYLVGSCLHKKDYNDVDIVICLSNENFERRYGSVEQFIKENNENIAPIVRQKWANDCYKRWCLVSDFTGLNVDLKIQYLDMFNQHINKSRIKLNTTNF